MFFSVGTVWMSGKRNGLTKKKQNAVMIGESRNGICVSGGKYGKRGGEV